MSKASKKLKKEFLTCSRCQVQFPNDRAQCPSCLFWNTGLTTNLSDDDTVLLSDVSSNPVERIATGPWDICWGTNSDNKKSGIANTSVTLLGGAPGAGKSTLSLQLADRICASMKREIIYICAEEDNDAVAARARRLRLSHLDRIRVVPMGSRAELGAVFLRHKPCAIIADSLPGITSDMDAAVEYCVRIKDYCVKLKAPAIIIDHVTKDQELAGLMALQHAVDTTLLFRKYEDDPVRELITVKNRFGMADVSVSLAMTETGLVLHHDLDDEDET